jgi:hypothetical protein
VLRWGFILDVGCVWIRNFKCKCSRWGLYLFGLGSGTRLDIFLSILSMYGMYHSDICFETHKRRIVASTMQEIHA